MDVGISGEEGEDMLFFLEGESIRGFANRGNGLTLISSGAQDLAREESAYGRQIAHLISSPLV